MAAKQLKLLTTLVSLIDNNGIDLSSYEISTEDLAHILDIDKRDVCTALFKMFKNLTGKVLYIKDPEAEEFTIYSIFSRVSCKNGTLIVQFNEEIKPFLSQVQFDKFKSRGFTLFRSKYSIRVYRLLEKYQHLKKIIFDLQELRSALGVKQGELKRFGDFHARVLKTAQRELASTPLAFDFALIKQGRGGRVVQIKFIFKNNFKNNKEKFIFKNNKESRKKRSRQLKEKLPADEDLERIYRKVNEETNAGDSVPIPDFFDAVKKAFPGVTVEWLKDKLIELDENGVIYLSEANNPRELEREELKIEIKGRGVLFYITWVWPLGD